MIGERKTKILVVDDHPFLREGIVGAINSQSDMVLIAEASNGQGAVEQFRIHRPDVTLMDLQMPVMNGTDAIIAIRTEFPTARIVVLTAYKGDMQALRAFKAGAVITLRRSSVTVTGRSSARDCFAAQPAPLRCS